MQELLLGLQQLAARHHGLNQAFSLLFSLSSTIAHQVSLTPDAKTIAV